MPDTLVLHDYFASAEGGGRLCSILAAALDADLGYGFARPGHPFVQGAANNPRERDLGLYARLPLWQQFKLARAFEYRSGFVRNYRTVIYSGFYTPLAVFDHPRGHNILYCHTPPRFIYDQREFYSNSLPAPLRPLLKAFIAYLQPRYEAAVARMDMIVANSHNVQQRIRRYLGCDAVVVYPPCETGRFQWQGQGDYYLSSARLDPLKRVDVVVEAFRGLPDKKLVVTSGGGELERLRKLAAGAPNIEFTGWVDEAELARLVGHAIAVIYVPRDEDFGMSPVEAMAAGKVVLGVAEGGLLESVVEGETGLLLPPEFKAEDLRRAVSELPPQRTAAMRAACEARAQVFRREVFVEKMRKLL